MFQVLASALTVVEGVDTTSSRVPSPAPAASTLNVTGLPTSTPRSSSPFSSRLRPSRVPSSSKKRSTKYSTTYGTKCAGSFPSLYCFYINHTDQSSIQIIKMSAVCWEPGTGLPAHCTCSLCLPTASGVYEPVYCRRGQRRVLSYKHLPPAPSPVTRTFRTSYTLQVNGEPGTGLPAHCTCTLCLPTASGVYEPVYRPSPVGVTRVRTLLPPGPVT